MSSNDGFRADWAQKDFYAELGVSKTATADEIKKAYRKLARANHPDSNPGDTAKHDKFKAVAEAYDVIGDPEKRTKYDEMRAYAGGFRGGFPAASAAAAAAATSTSTTCSATGPAARRRLRRHVRRPLRRRRRRGAAGGRAPRRAPTSRPPRRSASPTPSTASPSRCG